MHCLVPPPDATVQKKNWFKLLGIPFFPSPAPSSPPTTTPTTTNTPQHTRNKHKASDETRRSLTVITKENNRIEVDPQ